jgi:small nuclear ribonucleoprotein (snRNP)-like protein
MFFLNYLLIVMLAMPVGARSGEEAHNNDWSVLSVLQPGEKLFVKMKDDKKVKGILKSVSDEMLVLSHNNQDESIDREDILEIRLGHGRSLKKSILIGALVGTGSGAVFGGIVTATDDPEWISITTSDGIAIGAVVGAVLGTAVGAVIGLFRRQGDLIYKASPPQPFQ